MELSGRATVWHGERACEMDTKKYPLLVALLHELRELLGNAPTESEGKAAVPDRPACVPEGALWLSPLSERIVAAVAANGRWWMSGAQVALAIKVPYSNSLKCHLTSLVSRKILEARHGSGYRLRGVTNGSQ